MVRQKVDKTIIPINTAKKVRKPTLSSLVFINDATRPVMDHQKVDLSKKVKTINPYMLQLQRLYEQISLSSDNVLIHKILKSLRTTRSNRLSLKISQLVEQVVLSKKVDNYQSKTLILLEKY